LGAEPLALLSSKSRALTWLAEGELTIIVPGSIVESTDNIPERSDFGVKPPSVGQFL